MALIDDIALLGGANWLLTLCTSHPLGSLRITGMAFS
jgi:hypothetical protein